MRKNLSLIFYCIASVLILLQLGASFVRVAGQESGTGLIHVATLKSEPSRPERSHESGAGVVSPGGDMAEDDYL